MATCYDPILLRLVLNGPNMTAWLPPSAPHLLVLVTNLWRMNLEVHASDGDTIDGDGANIGVRFRTIAPYTTLIYFCMTSGTWISWEDTEGEIRSMRDSFRRSEGESSEVG
jgi:hypothetical protein